jgi:hypothetical protein
MVEVLLLVDVRGLQELGSVMLITIMIASNYHICNIINYSNFITKYCRGT